VTSEAYHGTTSHCQCDVSPADGTSDHRLGKHVATVPAPDSYRPGGRRTLGTSSTIRSRTAFDSLRASGVQSLSIPGRHLMAPTASLSDPAVLGPALRSAHQAGAVMIADEVPARVRTNRFGVLGLRPGTDRPDLVTNGQTDGNGCPVAAMVARPEVLQPFGTEVP